MQTGLQRLFNAAPTLLAVIALFIFICQFLVFYILGTYIGYRGPQPLLRLVTVLLSAGSAPAMLLGLAAVAHYLRTYRIG